jgi:hypothetical protein
MAQPVTVVPALCSHNTSATAESVAACLRCGSASDRHLSIKPSNVDGLNGLRRHRVAPRLSAILRQAASLAVSVTPCSVTPWAREGTVTTDGKRLRDGGTMLVRSAAFCLANQCAILISAADRPTCLPSTVYRTAHATIVQSAGKIFEPASGTPCRSRCGPVRAPAFGTRQRYRTRPVARRRPDFGGVSACSSGWRRHGNDEAQIIRGCGMTPREFHRDIGGGPPGYSDRRTTSSEMPVKYPCQPCEPGSSSPNSERKY